MRDEIFMRLGALRDPLAPPDRLVRVLRPTIQHFVGAMLDTLRDYSLCCGVGSQLVVIITHDDRL